MKKENKNLWRRYEKNRPIISNGQKQKRKSDRRKLHPQTKKEISRLFLSFTGVEAHPAHKTATSLESIAIESCYAMLWVYTTYIRDFPFVSFQLWTGFELRLQCFSTERYFSSCTETEREADPMLRLSIVNWKKACFAVEKNTSKSIKSYFWWVDIVQRFNKVKKTPIVLRRDTEI